MKVEGVSKESEGKLCWYRSAVEASHDSVYMVDRDYRYVFANDEHLSRLVEDGKITREDGGGVVGEKYGDVHPEEELKNFKEIVEKVLETGEPVSEEYEFLTKDRWSSRTYSPVRDRETGEVEGFVVVSKDITQRRSAEEKQDFLHTVLRHDLRNKVSVIEGYLDLLQESELPEDREQFLEKALKVTHASFDLIEKVGALRKVRGEEIREVRIGLVIDDIISKIEARAAGEGIEIRCDECKGNVYGGKLMEEVFFNILENSIKHSDCEKIQISGRKTDGEYIVTVEDDGRGISDDGKERIFEKGYKKGSSAGSGFGMYLVAEVIKSYGGSVEIKDSELGGARFDIRLKSA